MKGMGRRSRLYPVTSPIRFVVSLGIRDKRKETIFLIPSESKGMTEELGGGIGSQVRDPSLLLHNLSYRRIEVG